MVNGRCRRHGGASRKGTASPVYKHGRYSKYLPTRLLERYEAALGDRQLLTLFDDIAVLDSFTANVLERSLSGESDGAWQRLGELQRAGDTARVKRDAVALQLTIDEMRAIILRSTAEADARVQVMNLLERRRRLVESEQKRIVQLKQVITMDQAMMLIDGIMKLITESVHDDRALAQINEGLAVLTFGSGEREPQRVSA